MVLKGKATPKGKNKVVKVAKGQYVELAFEGEDQILTLLGEFGDAEPTHNHGAPRASTHAGDRRPAPQPDPRAGSRRRQHDDLGRRTSARSTTTTCSTTRTRTRRWRTGISSSPTAATASTATSATGSRSRTTRPPTAATTAAASSAPATSAASSSTRPTPGATRRSPPARPPRRSTRMLAPFDVWDRYDYDGDGDFDEPDGYIDHFQSVHAGEGEETGGGAQGRTPSGAIARTRTPASRRRTAPRSTARSFRSAALPHRQQQATGSATTRSSRRTVASACSRTSSVTTSACPTSTTPAATPVAPRTAPPGGRCGPRARTAPSRTTSGSHAGRHGRLGEVRPRLAQLDGRNAGETGAHKLSQSSANTKQAQGVFVVLPDKEVTQRHRRPVRRATASTTRAPATTSTTR